MSVTLMRPHPAVVALPQVYLWALFGLLWSGFSLAVFGQWLLSDSHFSPVPLTAADAISPQALGLLRLVEFCSLFVACVTLQRYVVAPLLRRELPLQGMLVLGALIAYCWDTTINYHDYLMAWNKHSVNFGTWAAFWPGHSGPTHYAEALFWGPPMYLYFGVGLGGLQWLLIQRLQRRGLSLSAALALTFIAVALVDLVAESVIIRCGAYAWPKTVTALTLWSGELYQFPLYEALLVACYASAYALLFRSQTRDGSAFIERGCEGRRGLWPFLLRLFAAFGFAGLIAGAYFMGFLLFSLGAGEAIALPPWLQYVE